MNHSLYLCAREQAAPGEISAMVIIAYGWNDARQLAALNSGAEGYEVWLDMDHWCTQRLGTAMLGLKEGVVLARVVPTGATP